MVISNKTNSDKYATSAEIERIVNTWIDAFPKENETVLINATIWNLGGADINNVVVRFYNGDPDSGGTQINGDKKVNITKYSNTITNVSWEAGLGENLIFFVKQFEAQKMFSKKIHFGKLVLFSSFL